MQDFQILQDYINETNQSNSVNDKLEVLKRYKDNKFLQQVFYYTYNPFFQYHVSVANLIKRADLIIDTKYDDLFKMLDDLHLCKITGHEAISNVNGFVKKFEKFKKEIHYIIGRNLETRITTTLINRIIPALVPEFDVALCEDYDKVKDNKKPKFDQDVWFASRKLDGLRTIAQVDGNGDTIFYSRAGKEFKTFNVVAAEIKKLGFKNIILDGEMCLLKANGDDDFQGIMKEYSKKNHTIRNPRYRLFDCLTVEEFGSQHSDIIFSNRLKRLDWLNDDDSLIIKKLEQTHLKNQKEFEDLRIYAADQGWEGIILRRDFAYEGKRSKNMLKVKQFQDAEYIVEDIISEPIRVINDINPEDLIDFKGRTYGELTKEELAIMDKVKKEQTEIMLSAIVIRHKGSRVKVGSGFSMEQRKLFHQNPSLIVGKTITVKYFEETENQHGEFSLRFPILKTIFEKERDV